MHGRQIRQPVNKRFIGAIGALIAFAVVFLLVLQPQPEFKSLYAYMCLVVLQGYVIEPLLALLAPAANHVLLPAAAIAPNRSAILLIGRSRSGKSSLSARAATGGIAVSVTITCSSAVGDSRVASWLPSRLGGK